MDDDSITKTGSPQTRCFVDTHLKMIAGRFLRPCRLNSTGALPGGTVATRNWRRGPGAERAAFIISTMNTL